MSWFKSNTWFGKLENWWNKFFGGIFPGFSKLNSGLSSFANSLDQSALTGADVQQNEWNAQQAQIARDWDEEMYLKYNSPSALISQYRQAGLNPSLMYGQNVSGNMNTSGPVASGSNSGGGLDLGSLLSVFGLKSDIEMNKAGARQRTAEAVSQEIQNEDQKFFQEQRKRETEQRIKNLETANAEATQRIENLKKQNITEEERALLVKAQRLAQESVQTLNEAQAEQIRELLPHNKKLLEANSASARARAALDMAQAAYQNGLIDSGYINQLSRSLWNENQESLQRQGILSEERLQREISNAIRTGTYFSEDEKFRNNLVRSMSMLGEVLQPYSGVLNSFGSVSHSSTGSMSSGTAESTSTSHTTITGKKYD